jgi:hypothetical protein
MSLVTWLLVSPEPSRFLNDTVLEQATVQCRPSYKVAETMWKSNSRPCMPIWLHAFVEKNRTAEKPEWCSSDRNPTAKMLHFEASTSFLPQVLRSIFRAHIGLAPFLTLFQLPREMIPLLRHVLPVRHLARIIKRIPMTQYQNYGHHTCWLKFLWDVPFKVQYPVRHVHPSCYPLLSETAGTGTGIRAD